MATTLTLVDNRPRTAPTVTASRTATLADALVAEDHAEDTGWLDPLDRMTCRVHRRWIHECAHSELHVIPVTGHRWCRPCRRELELAVDEVTRTATVHCPRCHRGPTTHADTQLIAACEASLTAARATRQAAAA
ncbi:hypothetical protein [Actinophytocola sp.]|jgi:hypothetical protein|uniref:hypothetical protein n=1 Tax=Actinophytocola sp. TaxID=1872138 RepID=UPI002ED908E0